MLCFHLELAFWSAVVHEKMSNDIVCKWILVQVCGSNSVFIIRNLYTWLPATVGQRFVCANDICHATRAQYFTKLECRLTADVTCLEDNCRWWQLTEDCHISVPTSQLEGITWTHCCLMGEAETSPPSCCQFMTCCWRRLSSVCSWRLWCSAGHMKH